MRFKKFGDGDIMHVELLNESRRRPVHWSWTYSFYAGIIIIIWITIQLILTHYFWLQPVMIFTGLLIIVCTMVPDVIAYYETK